MLSKIRVKYIFVLVVAALLALLLIQAALTAQVFNRRSTEFDDKFQTVMNRIATHHERADDVRRYLSVMNQDFHLQYKDMLREEFKSLTSSESSISIQDTSLFENGNMQKYLLIRGRSFDSISGISTEQQVLVRDVREMQDLFHRKGSSNTDSLNLAMQLNQRIIEEMLKKAKYVNETMVDVFRSQLDENPNKRLDIFFLDSALNDELKQIQLPKEYEYMVTDAELKPVVYTSAPEHYVTQMELKDAHKTLLFPSNMLDEDLYLFIRFPKEKAFVLKGMWLQLAVNLSLVALIIIALIFMFRTILTQKKLSEMKNDFISNMTHEFKTPISTISLACQAMNDSDVINDMNDQALPFVKMINEENNRLSLLVERILQSATLDKGELKLKKETVCINDEVAYVVRNAQFRLENSGGSIDLNMTNDQVTVLGDRMHIRNLISNLVDNGIKYSEGTPKLTVSLEKEGKITTLSVKDQGIGIKKEHLNKIFDKLYRIPTGNVHNVKGFGLGLSYVKAIAELHGWNITVISKHGSGSEFIITIKQ